MAIIHTLKNLSELEKLHWNVEIVVTTVLYGNQDIHIKSVEALAKATSSDKRLNMIIVDNKGDYDINALMESKELIDKTNWNILFYRRRKRSRLEQDAAYNHSCAIQEVFDVFQNGRIMASYPNFSPIIMLMDPDLFIIDKNYFEFIKRNLITHSVIGTRWTILKTHKFHNFPTPHLFITSLSTLRRLRLDYRSRPIARNVSRFLFKFRPLEYLAMYNSYDPGCKMNRRQKLNILFIEQYYWKNEIKKSKEKLNKIRQSRINLEYLNRQPLDVKEESDFWITKGLISAIHILRKVITAILEKAYIKNQNNLINKKYYKIAKISNVYRQTMLENINIKYFDDLNKEAIPQHQTSADVFHTDDCEIFAIHGHMNSKARKKDLFLDYIQTNKRK